MNRTLLSFLILSAITPLSYAHTLDFQQTINSDYTNIKKSTSRRSKLDYETFINNSKKEDISVTSVYLQDTSHLVAQGYKITLDTPSQCEKQKTDYYQTHKKSLLGSLKDRYPRQLYYQEGIYTETSCVTYGEKAKPTLIVNHFKIDLPNDKSFINEKDIRQAGKTQVFADKESCQKALHQSYEKLTKDYAFKDYYNPVVLQDAYTDANHELGFDLENRLSYRYHNSNFVVIDRCLESFSGKGYSRNYTVQKYTEGNQALSNYMRSKLSYTYGMIPLDY